MMNGLLVVQKEQHYAIYTPQGIQIAYLFLGQDGQYARDVELLNPVTKALSRRCGIKS